MALVVDAASTPHLSRKQARRLLDRYRVTSGKGFRLKDYEPADTAGHLVPRAEADARLSLGVEHLAALQEKLYAQDRWAMLCVFQAMDAAGKDGTIKHVMSGVNPQGVQVTSFKAPGPEALAHDFLQRCVLALPERGRSAYSTAATTRRCWSCACIRKSWRRSTCRAARSSGNTGWTP